MMFDLEKAIQYIFKAVRIKEWWNYKIQLLLAVAYLIIGWCEIPFESALTNVFLFSIWLLGVFSFGFFVNDIYDNKYDLAAGKSNFTNSISPTVKSLIIVFLTALTIAPWVFIHSNVFLLALVIIHFILAILYSAPPVRFKERGVFGILDCALIEISLPLLIIAASFLRFGNAEAPPLIIVLAAIWSFFFGVRNILFHQIDDYKNDSISNVKTFVVRYGLHNSNKIIDYGIFPIEILSFWSLICFLFFEKLTFYLIPVFILWLIVTIIIFKIHTPESLMYSKELGNHRRKAIYNLINAIYEIILPYSIMAYLVTIDKKYLILLAIHVVIFQRSVINFISKIFALAGKVIGY